MTYPLITVAGVYRSDAYYKRRTNETPKRFVRKYEIELFTEVYQYVILNEEKINLKKNTVIIAKPGQFRTSALHFSCHFVHARVSDATLCAAIDSLPNAFSISDEAPYLKLISQISSLVQKEDTASTIEITGLFMLLVSRLMREYRLGQSREEEQTEVKNDVVTLAQTFMSINYTEPITLADIAESVHLSPNYFHKLFTESCHITPRSYLRNVRLSKAKKLLQTTDFSITSISEKCGFSSYNYFCAVFKGRFGMTPMEYRKNKRHSYQTDDAD